MEIKNFNEYNFADIPTEAVSNITELEKSISSQINKEIVLIAYQSKKEGSAAE